ncbi:MAG: DUF4325 domain-containing protein [Candidatus Caenarcaniphilales bacterium]|nr:DUF4325 domain-containing protein [Candidatus Caenarcaniphilales bacterium]
MKDIFLHLFAGEYLIGREEGSRAFALIDRDLFQKYPEEKFFFNVNGVKVLAPSFCDEVFGELQIKYPGRLFIDCKISEGLKSSFDVIEETRNIKFDYTNHFGGKSTGNG